MTCVTPPSPYGLPVVMTVVQGNRFGALDVHYPRAGGARAAVVIARDHRFDRHRGPIADTGGPVVNVELPTRPGYGC